MPLKVTKKHFPFVGSWRYSGKYKCTAELITEWHIITVKHCAFKKADDPERDIKVDFSNGVAPVVRRRVKSCKIKNEVAVCKLASAIPNSRIMPVTLSHKHHTKNPIKFNGKVVKIWTVGMSSGKGSSQWKAKGPKRVQLGDRPSYLKIQKGQGPSGMKPGDSGGAWVTYTDKTEKMVLHGLLEGGGQGWMPAFVRKQIDEWTDGQARWTDDPSEDVMQHYSVEGGAEAGLSPEASDDHNILLYGGVAAGILVAVAAVAGCIFMGRRRQAQKDKEVEEQMLQELEEEV